MPDQSIFLKSGTQHSRCVHVAKQPQKPYSVEPTSWEQSREAISMTTAHHP